MERLREMEDLLKVGDGDTAADTEILNMGKKRDKDCNECDGNGWVYDYLGGCGDPECCGGPWQVQCTACDNDWEIGDEDEEDEPPANGEVMGRPHHEQNKE